MKRMNLKRMECVFMASGRGRNGTQIIPDAPFGQKDLRLVSHCPDHTGPLQRPAGNLNWIGILEFAQAYQLKQLINISLCFRIWVSFPNGSQSIM